MDNCVETINYEDVSHDNVYSPVKLESLKNKIESMEKIHHIEILRILKKYNTIKINENKSGIFINLSFLSNNILDEIDKYVQYIDAQEYSILDLESKQDEYKTLLYEKQDKENTLSYSSLSNKQSNNQYAEH